MIKKRQRESAEIPSSSLADIAFLLLVFFLLVTTIDVDTGIGLQLPPLPEENQEPPPIKERNMLNILVNQQGMILMDEENTSLSEVKQKVKDFVDNNGEDPELSESPQNAIVSIKAMRETPYRVYIDMFDEVVGAYNELRNTAAQSRFGVSYEALGDNSEERAVIDEIYKKNISIAEPDAGI